MVKGRRTTLLLIACLVSLSVFSQTWKCNIADHPALNNTCPRYYSPGYYFNFSFTDKAKWARWAGEKTDFSVEIHFWLDDKCSVPVNIGTDREGNLLERAESDVFQMTFMANKLRCNRQNFNDFCMVLPEGLLDKLRDKYTSIEKQSAKIYYSIRIENLVPKLCDIKKSGKPGFFTLNYGCLNFSSYGTEDRKYGFSVQFVWDNRKEENLGFDNPDATRTLVPFEVNFNGKDFIEQASGSNLKWPCDYKLSFWKDSLGVMLPLNMEFFSDGSSFNETFQHEEPIGAGVVDRNVHPVTKRNYLKGRMKSLAPFSIWMEPGAMLEMAYQIVGYRPAEIDTTVIIAYNLDVAIPAFQSNHVRNRYGRLFWHIACKKNELPVFEIVEKTNVRIHVQDEDKNPLTGKMINFKYGPFSAMGYSDDDGNLDISDVPYKKDEMSKTSTRDGNIFICVITGLDKDDENEIILTIPGEQLPPPPPPPASKCNFAAFVNKKNKGLRDVPAEFHYGRDVYKGETNENGLFSANNVEIIPGKTCVSKIEYNGKTYTQEGKPEKNTNLLFVYDIEPEPPGPPPPPHTHIWEEKSDYHRFWVDETYPVAFGNLKMDLKLVEDEQNDSTLLYILSEPLSQKIYEYEMEENPSAKKSKDAPVTNLNLSAARFFCERLNVDIDKKYGLTFRLPTKTEWLMAAKQFDELGETVLEMLEDGLVENPNLDEVNRDYSKRVLGYDYGTRNEQKTPCTKRLREESSEEIGLRLVAEMAFDKLEPDNEKTVKTKTHDRTEILRKAKSIRCRWKECKTCGKQENFRKYYL